MGTLLGYIIVVAIGVVIKLLLLATEVNSSYDYYIQYPTYRFFHFMSSALIAVGTTILLLILCSR